MLVASINSLEDRRLTTCVIFSEPPCNARFIVTVLGEFMFAAHTVSSQLSKLACDG